MAEPEQINAWREGWPWLFFYEKGGENHVDSFSSYYEVVLDWNCFPINITTWISTEEEIERTAETWLFTHPAWVRKPGPYGRT